MVPAVMAYTTLRAGSNAEPTTDSFSLPKVSECSRVGAAPSVTSQDSSVLRMT